MYLPHRALASTQLLASWLQGAEEQYMHPSTIRQLHRGSCGGCGHMSQKGPAANPLPSTPERTAMPLGYLLSGTNKCGRCKHHPPQRCWLQLSS
jgi:hypothetical protein